MCMLSISMLILKRFIFKSQSWMGKAGSVESVGMKKWGCLMGLKYSAYNSQRIHKDDIKNVPVNERKNIYLYIKGKQAHRPPIQFI